MEHINFQKQDFKLSSAETYACYTAKKKGTSLIVTGRGPDKEVQEGTILAGLPYWNLQLAEFRIEKIEYRPHKGEYSELWHWTATCKAV